MLNSVKNLLLAAVFVCCAASAYAQTAQMRVVGTITPGVCTPVVSSGGTVDYGVIDITTLKATANTQLGQRILPLTIQCTAPRAVAFELTDAMSSSVTPAGLPNTKFGLGKTANGENIGYYGVDLRNVLIDGGGRARILASETGKNGPWVDIGFLGYFSPNGRVFSPTRDRTSPIAFTTMSGELAFSTSINPASGLTLTQDVSLSGNATLTLYYP